MPILNSPDAPRKTKTELPKTATVILSSHVDKHFVEDEKNWRPSLRRQKQSGQGLVAAIERAIIDGEFVLID
jgi:hypothetical protein